MDLSDIISALKDFETFWKNFVDLMQGVPKIFGRFAAWDKDRNGDQEILNATKNVFSK